jgi:uncharacterized membrane protein
VASLEAENKMILERLQAGEATGTHETKARSGVLKDTLRKEPSGVNPVERLKQGVRKLAANGLAAELNEAKIGGTWLNRIGIVAFIFGLGFFLKYSFDNNWIGPAGRVIIGILAGLGLLAGGEKAQRKELKIFAQGLTGGGIAALYFAIFAAFSLYHLLGQLPAFGIMIMITITAVLLAVRYDAFAIAILGIIGGFLTPFFLSTGVPNQIGLFSYIALLDCGILALAYFKKWRSINIISFAFTILILLIWMAGPYSNQAVWTNQVFYTLFFAIFACLAIFYNVMHRIRTQRDDLFLIIANASVFFFLSYVNLTSLYDRYIGFLPFAMALIYFIMGYLAWLRNREDRFLVLSLWGVAVVFLTVTMPLQLHGTWITVAWAIEAATLLALGCYNRSRSLRISALAVLGIALYRLTFDAQVYLNAYYYQPVNPFWPLANIHMLPFVACIAGVFIISYLYYRGRETVLEDEKTWWQGFLVLGTALTAGYLSLETLYFCGQWGTSLFGSQFPAQEAKSLAVAVIWFLTGIVLTWLAARNSSTGTRVVGLMSIVYGIILAYGPGAAIYFDSDLRYWPILSWHSITYFAGIAAALYFAGKSPRPGGPAVFAAAVSAGAAVVANLMALAYLSLEAAGFYNSWGESLGLGVDTGNAIQMTLSVIWTLYAIGLMVAGFIRKNRPLRLMAIVIFAVTIVKVFLFDLANLDTIYRIISFIVLGALLVVVSYLYQSHKDRIFGQPPAQQDKGASH